jgi:hypothetical protein
MEKYIIQDLETWVYDILYEKPPLAAENNFVNSLYEKNDYL